MTCVVATQALIFQDGGLLAMGANLFNMAIVSVLVSHLVYTLIQKISVGKKWGLLAGGFLAAWVSVEAAALSCALQLSFSGTIPSRIVIPVMGGVHALIGLGEGLITIGALSYIYATRSDLLQAGSLYPKNSRGLLIGGTILASTLAILSPLASSYPDGLDSIAQRYGFMNLEHFLDFPPLSGYTMPGIYNPVYGTILAALLGAFVVFLLVGLIAFIRRHGLLKRE